MQTKEMVEQAGIVSIPPDYGGSPQYQQESNPIESKQTTSLIFLHNIPLVQENSEHKANLKGCRGIPTIRLPLHVAE